MQNTLAFLHEFARNHRQIGAVAPSGPRLARAMIEALGPMPQGHIIIELGAGTGSITRQLPLYYPAHPIIAVERSNNFAAGLRKELPNVFVSEACASELPEILKNLGLDNRPVGGIISGLPMLSLPEDLRKSIFRAAARTLPHGRKFIQFTYWKPAWSRISPPGLKLDRSNTIWLNIPPAAVLPFRRTRERIAPE